jgi:Rieske Fe-S protein
MERKEFIKVCGFACLGGSFLTSMILESCSSAKIISGNISDSDLIVPISSFLTKDNSYRKYIVVHHEKLSYPVCVYRFNENEYSALFMRCTHQGAELQVFGDKLQCPAHGSEFNDKGLVQNGPADTNLRTFPVTIQKNQLNISLK